MGNDDNPFKFGMFERKNLIFIENHNTLYFQFIFLWLQSQFLALSKQYFIGIEGYKFRLHVFIIPGKCIFELKKIVLTNAANTFCRGKNTSVFSGYIYCLFLSPKSIYSLTNRIFVSHQCFSIFVQSTWTTNEQMKEIKRHLDSIHRTLLLTNVFLPLNFQFKTEYSQCNLLVNWKKKHWIRTRYQISIFFHIPHCTLFSLLTKINLKKSWNKRTMQFSVKIKFKSWIQWKFAEMTAIHSGLKPII